MSIYLTTQKIIKEWTDYNEHMNMAYYVLIFDKAWEIILEKFKMGEHKIIFFFTIIIMNGVKNILNQFKENLTS